MLAVAKPLLSAVWEWHASAQVRHDKNELLTQTMAQVGPIASCEFVRNQAFSGRVDWRNISDQAHRPLAIQVGRVASFTRNSRALGALSGIVSIGI